jgi:hypothetical protein
VEEYEHIDVIITAAMLKAEKYCSKRYTKKFEWSPKLIQAVETVRFWRLLLQCSKGLLISYSSICRAREAAGLPNDLDTMDQPSIIKHLRDALSSLHQSQKSHVELHESYLHGLAEALVLDKKPSLGKKEHAQTLHCLTVERIQGLIARERRHRR